MDNFKPSIDFVEKTMDDVRSYEAATRRRKERLNAFLVSKPAFYLLSVAGALLAMLNLVGMTWTLLSPVTCL